MDDGRLDGRGDGGQWATGAWWVDGLSALALTPFLIKEAHEAWAGDADD
jgi:hypothetical protein